MLRFLLLLCSLMMSESRADDNSTSVSARNYEGPCTDFTSYDQDFGYVVSLSSPDGFHYCTGTLFKPTYVLIAANCLRYIVPNCQVVLFRDRSYRMAVRVKNRFVRREHGSGTQIGVVELYSPVPNSYDINYAKLIEKTLDRVPIEQYCSKVIVPGWSVTQDHLYKVHNVLMCQEFPVFSPNECGGIYVHEPEDFLCTGKVEVSIHSDCGAPLICVDTGEVIGVSSDCFMRAGSTPLSIRVDAYLDFIEDVTRISAAEMITPLSFLIVAMVIL